MVGQCVTFCYSGWYHHEKVPLHEVTKYLPRSSITCLHAVWLGALSWQFFVPSCPSWDLTMSTSILVVQTANVVVQKKCGRIIKRWPIDVQCRRVVPLVMNKEHQVWWYYQTGFWASKTWPLWLDLMAVSGLLHVRLSPTWRRAIPIYHFAYLGVFS